MGLTILTIWDYKQAANFSSVLASHKINLIIQICRVRCKQTFHTGFILNGRTGRMSCSIRLPAIMHTILTYLLTYLLTDPSVPGRFILQYDHTVNGTDPSV